MSLQITSFVPFLWLSNISLCVHVCIHTIYLVYTYIYICMYVCMYVCMYIPLLYPFICRWAFRLLPCLATINSASVSTGVHASRNHPSSQCLSSNQFLHSLIFFWPVSTKDNLQTLPLFFYCASMSPSTSNPSSKGLFMDQSTDISQF